MPASLRRSFLSIWQMRSLSHSLEDELNSVCFHLVETYRANLIFLTHKVSLDTLRPDRFAAITRRKGLEAVLASLDAALAHGYGGR